MGTLEGVMGTLEGVMGTLEGVMGTLEGVLLCDFKQNKQKKAGIKTSLYLGEG